MHLIIQIPCLNEEDILPKTLSQLPRQVEGFDDVKWLLIDDGSTDKSIEIAKQYGVDHIVRLTKQRGLGKVFLSGIDACLSLGADVVVNIDADNQYNSGDISKLTQPILDEQADIVIGERPIDKIKSFSPLKKFLQKLGSLTVSFMSNTKIPDATSGFRAISREAALQMNVYTDYTYTLETLIQAGQNKLKIISVPVRINDDFRPSRLVKSIPDYLKQSIITITRFFVIYRPFMFFLTLGSIFFLPGFAIGLRFLIYYFAGNGAGHVQSLILAAILIGIGFQSFLLGFLVDLFAVNRRLSEDIQYKLRKIYYNNEP